MKHYNERVRPLCEVEQDLAMGTDVNGHYIKDPVKSVIKILLDKELPPTDKVRIIMLYVLLKNGKCAFLR